MRNITSMKQAKFYFYVIGEQGLLGRSVLVVLANLNKVVDRLDYYAGQIYYLLWSPDGKQIGEASIFLECNTANKLYYECR